MTRHPDQTSPMTVGPEAFFEEPTVTCPECGGSGVEVISTTVYEHGCGFSHASTDEQPCPTCGGRGMVGWIDPGEGVRTAPCPDCTPDPEDDIVF